MAHSLHPRRQGFHEIPGVPGWALPCQVLASTIETAFNVNGLPTLRIKKSLCYKLRFHLLMKNSLNDNVLSTIFCLI